MKQYIADVFADKVFCGNQAASCIRKAIFKLDGVTSLSQDKSYEGQMVLHQRFRL